MRRRPLDDADGDRRKDRRNFIMSDTYIVTAKTIEEAIATANKTYADAEHEISYDILEMPKKGFLGIGAKDAMIRVTVNEIRDADLASLVSDLKSMKLHTDRDGRQNDAKKSKPRPAEKATSQKPATSAKPTDSLKSANGARSNAEKPNGNVSGKPADAPYKRENATSSKSANDARSNAGKPNGNASGKSTNAPRNANAPRKWDNVEKDVRPVAQKSEDGAKKASENDGLPNVGLPKEHAEVIVSAPVGLYDLPENKPESKSENKPESQAEIAVAPESTENVGFSEEESETEKENNVKVGVSEEEMTYALEFANTLLRDMQLDARAERGTCPEGETYEISEGADVYPRIEIVGDGAGILIGHHGETLDAVQYLVNLSAIRKARKANGHGDYVKIVVDVENYRTKREETLRALARRMAARAVKIKKNVFLEPMNAYERRIIHSELQSFENVSTHSVGTDRNRKIIITYDGPDRQTPASRRKPGRPESDVSVRPERAEKAGERPVGVRNGERPRPRKPQKMPIEKLPEALPGILAAGNAEPEEILSIED